MFMRLTCLESKAAVTEESTPPDMATTTEYRSVEPQELIHSSIVLTFVTFVGV